MSFDTVALAGFYTKCGVSDEDAEAFASRFGSRFIEIQAQRREAGAGVQAKAQAAVGLSDLLLATASTEKDFPMWSAINGSADFNEFVRVVRAAGMCSVAVYAYALDSDVSSKVQEAFGQFLAIAKVKAIDLGIEFDPVSLSRSFTLDSSKMASVAAALGSRKGFFSKIFG